MIGAAVLVVGLLLILAGLASAAIPGGAAFASPGSAVPEPGSADAHPRSAFGRLGRTPIRAFVLSPIHPATWRANGAILEGFLTGTIAFFVIVGLFSTGATVLLAGVGLVPIVLGIEGSRLYSRLERRRAMRVDPRPLFAHPYKELRGSLRELALAEFADESRWRDVLYVGVNFPLAVIEWIVTLLVWLLALTLLTMPIWYDVRPAAILPDWLAFLGGRSLGVAMVRTLLGAALLPVAASLSQLVMALHRAVVSGLLCTSESRELRRQVQTLQRSRSAVLDVEASELRRIERDLHDGAQQRLVRLSLDLSLASERIESDPEAARKLVLESRDQARLALAELRDLVRGVAPAILLDRGLVAALPSIASRSTIPATVQSSLDPSERLPDAIERAAYFVVAEALANAAKHSGATRCEVRCRREGGALVVEVFDDGSGGATIGAGGGLAGLVGRVEAVDGRLTVSSPPGGPTLLRAEIPVPAWVPERRWMPARPR